MTLAEHQPETFLTRAGYQAAHGAQGVVAGGS